MTAEDWEARVAALWERLDAMGREDFVEAMKALAAERGEDDPDALFEVGGAHDSTGYTEAAVGYYERAVGAGLSGVRRRRVSIQMASSLRETGHPDRALAMIEEEKSRGSDEYDDALAMCEALTLAKLGRDREGLSVALTALAPHLPRYQRSTVNYARGLVGKDPIR
ncbi:tetratricopeptide repeat protein [Glycomyces harbinensis]|uniref:Tetratrico peptide repeat-containing protein n=1 Tax=Glycomyces harbinensis TaxID=58114 RepID=A0A1G6RCA6_9ACTN|nr:tetratricopeptide repeat protein [Glycomyces harbinensis]SDD01924.1 Tetratrico peptide repeat-containing protein [Glycomyces harbinensis]